jgi:ribosome-binding protein aMBF1 (putative translation factor)
VVNDNSSDAAAVRKSLYTPGQQKVAETIRTMRVAADLTQRDLAARLKRPLNVVSRIEAGQRRVDFLEWVALCQACGADPVESGRRLLDALVRRP